MAEEKVKLKPKFTSVNELIQQINSVRHAYGLKNYQPAVHLLEEDWVAVKTKQEKAKSAGKVISLDPDALDIRHQTKELNDIELLTRLLIENLSAIPDLLSPDAEDACQICWSLMRSIETVGFREVSRLAEGFNFFGIADVARGEVKLLSSFKNELRRYGREPYQCSADLFQNLQVIEEFPVGPFKSVSDVRAKYINNLLVQVYDFLSWRVGLNIYSAPIDQELAYVTSQEFLASTGNYLESATELELSAMGLKSAMVDFLRGVYFQPLPWKNYNIYRKMDIFKTVYLLQGTIYTEQEYHALNEKYDGQLEGEKLYYSALDPNYVMKKRQLHQSYVEQTGVDPNLIADFEYTQTSYQEDAEPGYTDYLVQLISQLELTDAQQRAGIGSLLFNYLSSNGGQTLQNMCTGPLINLVGVMFTSNRGDIIWRIDASGQALEAEILMKVQSVMHPTRPDYGNCMIDPDNHEQNQLIPVDEYRRTLSTEDNLFFEEKQKRPVLQIRATVSLEVTFNEEKRAYEVTPRITSYVFISRTPLLPANYHNDYSDVVRTDYVQEWRQRQQNADRAEANGLDHGEADLYGEPAEDYSKAEGKEEEIEPESGSSNEEDNNSGGPRL